MKELWSTRMGWGGGRKITAPFEMHANLPFVSKGGGLKGEKIKEVDKIVHGKNFFFLPVPEH